MESRLTNGVLYVPPVLIYGSGTTAKVGEESYKLGGTKGLIVTDEVIIKLGILDSIQQSLAQTKIKSVIYPGVATEPTVEFVTEGLQSYRENGCDFLVAIGGGSAIDAAKAIAVMATNQGAIEDYQGVNKIPARGAPVVAIPTTAGTGSEATRVAIITDTVRDIKMLYISPFLVPQVAIADPLLTLSMPHGLTAATGIDALTHAIEAYVSLKAHPMADIFCLSAIELIAGNLKQAWTDGNNIVAREKTMLGALQAGIAFSNSSVALVHGMSRPIGACFHVAHGVSNAALLSVVTEFSLSGNPERYARIASVMGESTAGLSATEAAAKAAEAIKRLVSDIKIPSLSELGVGKEELIRLAPKMAEDALASGSPANNPRQATKEEIIELYLLAYNE
jgi:alcohol dehydrogenase class IV